MELTYTNTTGLSVTLTQGKPYFLTALDGTGTVRQSINTFQAPEQDGAFYISSSMDMRNVTISGTILASDTDEAYAYRRSLLRVFTPKQQGVLTYRERQISCIVEEVSFSVGNVVRAPNFFISLLCPSPFFEAINAIRVELASWQELFSFPLEIPSPGIELGERQPSQIIAVDNEGDVACGCLIVFTATGTVANPELRNLDTGEYLKINTTLTYGQEIYVYTHFAGKKVTLIDSGTESNAFSLLDIGSTFLQLYAARNTLRYDADNIDALEVCLHYSPKYLGV